MPVTEETTLNPESPYGWSKLMTEVILRHTADASRLRYGVLRYCNVAGADPQGRTGQSTKGATQLIKVACEAALGRKSKYSAWITLPETEPAFATTSMSPILWLLICRHSTICAAVGTQMCFTWKRGPTLQLHYHRAEHWVIVHGTAEVTIDNEVKIYHENEAAYLPIGCVHRMRNPGKTDRKLIEVQVGSYTGEDDIIRFEDVYARS
jgi:mannose-6-phosphate isomerase-like protein (cupin superfamily)